MRILVVGGGSGGHVTPVLAVLSAIKHDRPRTELRFWCDRSFLDSTRSLLKDSDLNVTVTPILSGKFRRYSGISLGKQLRDIPTLAKNIRDGALIIGGFIQSLVLLVIWWPDAVFTKGGFVCLPVGLAARVLRIPLVIHESDSHSGLTNRILSRFATKILTGAPTEYYPYDAGKMEYVGIPIAKSFVPLTDDERQKAKKAIGFDADRPLVVVTGGGLGARRLNDAVIDSAATLLKTTNILHMTGKINYDEAVARAIKDDRYRLVPFVSKNMNMLLGAADVVIARAGATTMLELAALHKPTILVPNAQLTGDHQTKNAKVYDDADAAIVLSETAIAKNPELLTRTVVGLLSDSDERHALETSIGKLAKPNAATDVARTVIAVASRKAA